MLLCIWNRRVLQQQRSFHSTTIPATKMMMNISVWKKLSSKKKIYIVNLARNILYIWNRTPRIKSKTTHYHTFAIHLRVYNVWDQSFLTTWSNTSIINKGKAFYIIMQWIEISISINNLSFITVQLSRSIGNILEHFFQSNNYFTLLNYFIYLFKKSYTLKGSAP